MSVAHLILFVFGAWTLALGYCLGRLDGVLSQFNQHAKKEG